VYFFSQAQNYEEGVKEAEYTLSLIRQFDINYPIAFDTEESSSPNNTGRADNISVQSRTDATRGFCETIENAGYDVLIYASSSWLKEKLDLSQLEKYNIWLANYTGATQENPLAKPSKYKGNYVMWQYTDSGTVNGINGGVDCDIYYYLR
jgi:GH25 family lysozyme M1 (1,4-beta-N-acetylmuramidase)